MEDLSGPVIWRFPNTGLVEFSSLLDRLSLPGPLAGQLMSLAQIDASSRGMVVRPSRELVMRLTRQSRGELYAALCGYMANEDQQKQFVFRGVSTDQWFDRASISPKTRELVEPLIYHRDGFMYFADLRSIAGSVTPRSELPELVKTLARDATVIVHLKLNADSDIESLVRYWGVGGRAGEIRPILESLITNDGERRLNIVHLLPPLARRKLYTYSDRLDSKTRPRRDCNWTVANFFNETPDDKFCDPRQVAQMLRNDCTEIRGDLQLGDIAVVLNANNMSIHSAVHIADDIFFHKCGPGASAPWTLARKEDLVNYYPRIGKVSLRYYRRKDL